MSNTSDTCFTCGVPGPVRRLRVGDTLYGFCGGYFGRDSYTDKTVEAVGKDWVVTRNGNGIVETATTENGETIDDALFRYTTPEGTIR